MALNQDPTTNVSGHKYFWFYYCTLCAQAVNDANKF